jgi:hypothetical protein
MNKNKCDCKLKRVINGEKYTVDSSIYVAYGWAIEDNRAL